MIGWTTAFIDLPGGDLDETAAFWGAVTGYTRSANRGTNGEFSTLEASEGSPYLKLQEIGSGHSRIHIDLHVDDVDATADRAIALGATQLQRTDFAVLRSPGGLQFCLVSHCGGVVPPAAHWPDGTSSIVNQVTIDIPASIWSQECDFWSELTGWPYSKRTNEDFRVLHADPAFALRILLQRDPKLRRAAAHLDVGASSRSAEVVRHIGLGAVEIEELDGWSRMIDPSGMPYCITDRDPLTGRLR